MSSLQNSLSTFFFKPVSPYPVAIFRILFGLCVCSTLLLLHSDWLNWFGIHSWISIRTIHQAETGFRLNLFAFFPNTDEWIEGIYWLLLTASVTFTLGFGTRLSSIIVFLGLNSINQRMPLMLHGGDAFLRSASFFMMFASAGTVISIDMWIKLSPKPLSGHATSLVPPWPMRLIQCQLAIIYLASFWWKAKGHTWWDGTALFYVLHLREVRQFPVSQLFYNVWILRLGSWTVMTFELLFPVLVWLKRFRTPVLIAGLLFHLSLEYTLNIPMFQWEMLSSYVLFLDFGCTCQGRITATNASGMNTA
jgi:hypothetical protein